MFKGFNPIAVDIAYELSDKEAIIFGQKNQSDLESGGIQGIAAKETATQLGEESLIHFTDILLATDENDIQKNQRLNFHFSNGFDNKTGLFV